VSAPTSHDPLVVTTTDGVTWVRRAVVEGRGLYAVTDSCKCPEYLMASLAELAEHGIAGSAGALPVPVGPESSESAADAESAGVRAHCEFLMRDVKRLRARVAELETAPLYLAEYDGMEPELHRTIEGAKDLVIDGASADMKSIPGRSWDLIEEEDGVLQMVWVDPDTDRPLAEGPGRVTPMRVQPAPVPDAEVSADKLTRLLAPTQTLREDPHDGPLSHQYRLSHDMPEPAHPVPCRFPKSPGCTCGLTGADVEPAAGDASC